MAVNNLNTPGVGIQPSIVDAKGDLLVGTANDAIDRLGVTGTTGAVLTADAGETTGLKWAAAGSVGGLVHIETQTFSAVSSFSFSNDVFTIDYDNYLILCDLTASTNANIDLRLRLSGTDNSTSNYQRQLLSAENTTVGANRNTNQTAASAVAVVNTGRNNFELNLFSPALAIPTTGNSTCGENASTTFPVLRGATFGHNVSTAFDSASFLITSGNMTGTIRLYVYKN